MFTFTSTTRVILVAAAALAVAAPAASAKPFVVTPGGPVAFSEQAYHGTYRPASTPIVVGSPDVRDRVGTVNQVTGIHPIPVATKVVVTSNSFDWTDAAIGAGFAVSLGLIGAGALGLRGRRRMALGV
jgi:hypothetical protein